MAIGSRQILGPALAGVTIMVAACAGTPERTAATAAPATHVAAGATPAPERIERASQRVCRDRVQTGRLLPKRVCTTAREDRIEDEAARQRMNNAIAGAPITGG